MYGFVTRSYISVKLAMLTCDNNFAKEFIRFNCAAARWRTCSLGDEVHRFVGELVDNLLGCGVDDGCLDGVGGGRRLQVEDVVDIVRHLQAQHWGTMVTWLNIIQRIIHQILRFRGDFNHNYLIKMFL